MFILLWLLCVFPFVSSMYTDGEVVVPLNSTTYLSDFSFGADGGYASWSVNVTGEVFLLMFTEKNYEKTKSNCDCECAMSLSLPSNRHVLTTGHWVSEDSISLSSAEYVYVTLLRCVPLFPPPPSPSSPAYRAKYSLRMTRRSGLFREIPFNAIGLMEMYLSSAGFLLGCLMVLVFSYSWWDYDCWRATAPVPKLFALLLALGLLDSVCMSCHFVLYAKDGVGSPSVEGLGRVLEATGRLLFFLLLLLCSKGFGMRAHGQPIQRRELFSLLIFCLTLVYFTLALWYLLSKSPGDVTFVYDATPGIVLAASQATAGIWYVVECLSSFFERRRHKLLQKQVLLGHLAASNKSTSPSAGYGSISPSPMIRMWNPEEFSPFLHRNGKKWLYLLLVLSIAFFTLPLASIIGLFLPNYQDERMVEVSLCTSRAFCYFVLFCVLLPESLSLLPLWPTHDPLGGGSQASRFSAKSLRQLQKKLRKSRKKFLSKFTRGVQSNSRVLSSSPPEEGSNSEVAALWDSNKSKKDLSSRDSNNSEEGSFLNNLRGSDSEADVDPEIDSSSSSDSEASYNKNLYNVYEKKKGVKPKKSNSSVSVLLPILRTYGSVAEKTVSQHYRPQDSIRSTSSDRRKSLDNPHFPNMIVPTYSTDVSGSMDEVPSISIPLNDGSESSTLLSSRDVPLSTSKEGIRSTVTYHERELSILNSFGLFSMSHEEINGSDNTV